MLFGIVIGTYSSIFVAAPLLLLSRRQARVERAGRQAVGQGATPPASRGARTLASK